MKRLSKEHADQMRSILFSIRVELINDDTIPTFTRVRLIDKLNELGYDVIDSMQEHH